MSAFPIRVSSEAEPEPEPEAEPTSVSEPEPESEPESASEPESSCKVAYETCAAPGWGPACCTTGHECAYHTDSGYARCLPSRLTPTPSPPTSPHPPSSVNSCKSAGQVCAEPTATPSCCTSGHECVYWKDSGYARCTMRALLQEISQHQPSEERPQHKRRASTHNNRFLSRGQAMIQAKAVISMSVPSLDIDAEL